MQTIFQLIKNQLAFKINNQYRFQEAVDCNLFTYAIKKNNSILFEDQPKYGTQSKIMNIAKNECPIDGEIMIFQFETKKDETKLNPNEYWVSLESWFDYTCGDFVGDFKHKVAFKKKDGNHVFLKQIN